MIWELCVGFTLVALVLFDVFETVIVPRRTGRWLRLAPYLLLWLWPLWRQIGLRLNPAWRREDFLGTFAPSVLVLVLVSWVLTLIVGFGMALHALHDQIRPPIEDYPTAFYVAGTSLLTIGFGDFVPTSNAARITVLVAGASGLAVLALVISLAFNLYGSFARREVFVLLLDSRAGVPPSGVVLLETFGRQQIVDQLASTFREYEAWTAEMLDSQLSYPILTFFRSSHDGQSWISALGAVLDASTLLITAVREETLGERQDLRAGRAGADLMYQLGRHALVDLTQGRYIRRRAGQLDNAQPGVDRSEFEEACRRLGAAGYETICTDEAWQNFAQHRSVYAERLNLLARYLASPPTAWIGDRSILTKRLKDHLH